MSNFIAFDSTKEHCNGANAANLYQETQAGLKGC